MKTPSCWLVLTLGASLCLALYLGAVPTFFMAPSPAQSKTALEPTKPMTVPHSRMLLIRELDNARAKLHYHVASTSRRRSPSTPLAPSRDLARGGAWAVLAGALVSLSVYFALLSKRVSPRPLASTLALAKAPRPSAAVPSPEPHLAFGAFLVAFGKIRTTGPPVFWMPSPEDGSELESPTYDPDLPTMYYLPGIDGTGVAARQQLPRLAKHFNLWSLTIPVADRTSFAGLVDLTVAFIERQASERDAEGAPKPVYVLGESFGGALALGVAARCPRVNRLILVNPSTSFSRTVWPNAGPLLTQTPEAAYPLVALLLGPILANPISLAMSGVDADLDPLSRLAQLRDRLLEGLPAFRTLAQVLPPATLEHKLRLLRESCGVLDDRALADVQARVLLFGSELDLLLPSAEEVRRLARRLPIAIAQTVPGRSHALLQEAGVDLMTMMRDEGFYTHDLVLTGPVGASTTIEVPTPKEVERLSGRFGVNLLQTLLSPVFMTVDENNRVRRGVQNLAGGHRPVLLVGNHQTLAPDLGLIIKTLLEEGGVLARGLSHPVVTGPAGEGRDEGPGAIGGTFRSFGAVTVSGRNLYDLMANNEVALLYPGGVREAYKRKGEEYQLVWPDRPEFVRIAARFGAVIVPLAAVGADDSFNVVLDSDDLLKLPILGEQLRRRSDAVPSARPGRPDDVADFISPLVLPKVTETRRYYFLLGKPIPTDPSMDRERCADVYEEVKAGLAAGIDWLVEKRQQDPYQFIAPRALYEATWGIQAPTFPELEGAAGPLVATPPATAVPASPTPAADAPLPVPGTVKYPDWYPEDP